MKKREILLIPTLLFAGAGIMAGIIGDRGIAEITGAKGVTGIAGIEGVTGIAEIEGVTGIAGVLMGLLPGALLALLSLASRGNVGMGDAIMLAAVGAWSGSLTAFVTLMTALVIQAAISVIYRQCGGRKKELPFVPALLGGYIISLFVVK